MPSSPKPPQHEIDLTLAELAGESPGIGSAEERRGQIPG